MSSSRLLRLRPPGTTTVVEEALRPAAPDASHAELVARTNAGYGPYSARLTDELRPFGWEVLDLALGVPRIIDAWERENGPLPAGGDRTEAYVLAVLHQFNPQVLIDTNVKFISRDTDTAARRAAPDLQLTVATLGTPKRFSRALAADIVMLACPSFEQALRVAGARHVHSLPHAFDPRALSALRPSGQQWPLVFSGSIGAPGQGARALHLEAMLHSTPIECWVDERLQPASARMPRTLRSRAADLLTGRFAGPQLIKHLGMVHRMSGRFETTLDEAIRACLTNDGPPAEWSRESPLAQRFPGRVHPARHGSAMFELLLSSNIVFHHPVDNAGGCPGALRIFEATGAGAALLVERSQGLDMYFEPGLEVATYGSPEECVSIAQDLIRDDGLRLRIAQAGHDRTLKDHSFSARAALLHDVLQDQLSSGRAR